MKKILLLTWMIFLGGILWANESEKKAEDSYAAGNYKDAIEIYSNILAGGNESAMLYYNLGNCYYKLGENTKAILNYERALLLNPGDEMTRYNLKMANKAIVDKIEILPEFFLSRWYKGIRASLSADQWGYVSVALFIFFLIMLALFIYSRSISLKKTGFLGGIIVLLFFIVTIIFASQQNRRITEREYAIIMTPSVTVKGAPDDSGTSLFLIHEGLKVRVMEEVGEWYNIRLVDGNEGWVAKSDIEKI